MALYIGGTAVDATAAEIDVLDGLDRGSIIYGNASSATTVLGQGTADQVLTSDGTDIAWATNSIGKEALQLVHAQESHQDRSTTSNSYVDLAGNTPSITTHVANSDILILAYSGMADGAGGSATQYNLKRAISGGATTNEIYNEATEGSRGICESRHTWGNHFWMYLDSLSESAGTTITYTIRMRVTSGSGGRGHWGYSNGLQSLTLIEIAP